MGVMSCYRKNCDNIMCDTYIDDVGYICWECKEEFKDYIEYNKIRVETEGEIRRELKIFMDTRKGDYFKGNEISIDDFFNSNTR
ncbi:MAG: hypothetical protein ACOC3V_00755 [bacterium]